MTESLLKNQSSFLYGRKPAGTVPVYALVKNCVSRDAWLRIKKTKRASKSKRNALTLLQDSGLLSQRQSNDANDLRAQIALRERMQQVNKIRKEAVAVFSFENFRY